MAFEVLQARRLAFRLLLDSVFVVLQLRMVFSYFMWAFGAYCFGDELEFAWIYLFCRWVMGCVLQGRMSRL